MRAKRRTPGTHQMPQDEPEASLPLGTEQMLSVAPTPEPCSDTRRRGRTADVLDAMSRAFRVSEDARTLAWMALDGWVADRKTRDEVLVALEAFERVVRELREKFDAMTN